MATKHLEAKSNPERRSPPNRVMQHHPHHIEPQSATFIEHPAYCTAMNRPRAKSAPSTPFTESQIETPFEPRAPPPNRNETFKPPNNLIKYHSRMPNHHSREIEPSLLNYSETPPDLIENTTKHPEPVKPRRPPNTTFHTSTESQMPPSTHSPIANRNTNRIETSPSLQITNEEPPTEINEQTPLELQSNLQITESHTKPSHQAKVKHQALHR